MDKTKVTKKRPSPDKAISTSQLKTHCAAVVDEVARTRQAVVLTKRGRPVAKLVPLEDAPASLFGFLRGCVTVNGDLLEPLDVVWEAAE